MTTRRVTREWLIQHLGSVCECLRCISNISFAADFYDDVADLIPGYVNSSGRGDFKARVSLPEGASNPKIILAQSGVDPQDNVDYSESLVEQRG